MKIKSRNIVLKNKVIAGTLVIENGMIQTIGPYADEDAIDYGELILAPGLIDIHDHGYAGWSFTGTSSIDDIDHLRTRMLLEGVTSMLATTSFRGMENVLQSIHLNVKRQMTSILGFHFEGPFLNSDQYGAAPPDTQFLKPDVDYMEKIWRRAEGLLKMVTIAPEIPGNEEVIAFLNSHEVKVAVGHSNVTYAQLETIKAQVDSMTHLCNAMSGIHHREIGALGFGLLDPDVRVELITDGIHVSRPMLELTFRLKSVDKIMLISDTVPLAGLDQGRYAGPNGEVVIGADGKVMNEFGKINGSSFPLLNNVRFLKNAFDFSLPDLFRMASYNQAQFLGTKNIGEIKIGNKADLLVLDNDLQLSEIYKNGEPIAYHSLSKEKNPQINDYLQEKEFLNFYAQ